jgi:hypothetical protein
MEFQVAVVKDVVLDDTSKYFTNVGEYNGLGSIYFEVVKGNYKSKGFAKPYFSNISNFPLLEELVYIFSLPSPDIQNNNYKKVYYYITPINVWNSNHHNGIPNIFRNTEVPESQQRDYTQTEAGAVRRVEDGSSDIILGKTFKEKSNIKPLRKFEGDFVLEGRLGNSIRFGSTILLNDKPITPWSTGSNSGDPIILIRNGQGDKGSVGYLPTVEDINLDPSSIYLTSTQNIPLVASSTTYFSYKTDPPTNPNQYTGKQILVNSGRLVFNTTEDHLLLSSVKSISLSSLLSVNLDASEVIMQTGKIYLGSKNANEQLVLGNTAVAQLEEIVDILKTLLNACKLAANSGGPVASLKGVADTLTTRLNSINLKAMLSNSNYTV